MKEKTPIKVLLVDDQPDFLEPISYLLKSNGYEVLLANNGETALEIIKTQKPDIVFLDIKMPIMDGLTALTHIRDGNKELPVVMLTGHPEEESEKLAQELGVSGFFPKRGNVWQLPTIIRNVLKTGKAS